MFSCGLTHGVNKPTGARWRNCDASVRVNPGLLRGIAQGLVQLLPEQVHAGRRARVARFPPLLRGGRPVGARRALPYAPPGVDAPGSPPQRKGTSWQPTSAPKTTTQSRSAAYTRLRRSAAGRSPRMSSSTSPKGAASATRRWSWTSAANGGSTRKLQARTGCRVEGVDYVDFLVQMRRAENAAAGVQDKVNIQQGTILDIPFPDEHFDFVFCRTNRERRR